jgi:hypothetical protein
LRLISVSNCSPLPAEKPVSHPSIHVLSAPVTFGGRPNAILNASIALLVSVCGMPFPGDALR